MLKASDDAGIDVRLHAGWRILEGVLAALALTNLLLAVVVRWLGASLHPLFADPDTALLFLVTGLGLLAHAGLLALMRWRLCVPGEEGRRGVRRLRAFMRLPVHRDFAAARRLARLRMRGRPMPRRHGAGYPPGRAA